MTPRVALISAAAGVLAGGLAAADVAAPSATNELGEVKFAFDSSTLPRDATALVDPATSFAGTHADARIVLDAHCDPVGTSPYNIALAIRRAQAVKEQLMSQGVLSEQIVFAIYGKDGARRATHADDRRVTLWWTREPLAVVSRVTFAGHGTAVTWGKPLSVAEIDAPPAAIASR